MRISANFAALKKTKWYEYAVRMALGGALTVGAGLLAKYCGPVFGGLFLAFPAIFPAGATLLEKHARQKKQRAGIVATTRGQEEAALDAMGASMGALGLTVFAVIIWKLLPIWNAGAVLLTAVGAWMATSFVLWWIRKKHHVISRRPTMAKAEQK
jgi:hypothetical protein